MSESAIRDCPLKYHGTRPTEAQLETQSVYVVSQSGDTLGEADGVSHLQACAVICVFTH